MMLGNRVLVFAFAFVVASVARLIFALLDCGGGDSFAFALAIVVVYWRLLDKGGTP